MSSNKFFEVDKKTLQQHISAARVSFVPPPKSLTSGSANLDSRIKAVQVDISPVAESSGDDKKPLLAPFLYCDACKKLFLWFKKTRGQWVNQSGVSAIKRHLEKNCAPATSTSNQLTIHRSFQCAPSTSKPPLPKEAKEQWQQHVVKLVCAHPTVSINAMAQIASSCANFASSVTHRNNKINDYSIGRTYISSGLMTEGEQSHAKLQHHFRNSLNDPDAGVSCMIDFWSGRHEHRLSYFAIVACGLDKDWRWFSYPLKICDLDDVPHDASFTFKILEECIKSPDDEKQGELSQPIFIVSDNEPKMVAAFDGRYPTTLNLGGRIGCTEHALSTCVKDVFEKSPPELLSGMLSNLTSVESFYNVRDQNAKRLKRAIPDKSTTRPWRFQHSRLRSAVDNYTVFLSEEDCHVSDNLPPLPSLKSLLDIMEAVKCFFDRVEVDEPTSHLSYLNYLTLDIHLFQMQISEEVPAIARETCCLLRNQMRKKLWPYCGSSFAKAACYLSGIDVCNTALDMVKTLRYSSKKTRELQVFMNEWEQEMQGFKSSVVNYLNQLLDSMHISDIPTDKVSDNQEREPSTSSDPFETLFAPRPKRMKTSLHEQLETEMLLFETIRVASRHPTKDFWKEKGPQMRLLSKCAKILFSTPVSSASVERLFSEAGILLSKLRKRLKPDKLSAMIYTKYACKLETVL